MRLLLLDVRLLHCHKIYNRYLNQGILATLLLFSFFKKKSESKRNAPQDAASFGTGPDGSAVSIRPLNLPFSENRNPISCSLSSDMPLLRFSYKIRLFFSTTLDQTNRKLSIMGQNQVTDQWSVRERNKERDRVREGLWKCNIRLINHSDCQVLSHLIM